MEKRTVLILMAVIFFISSIVMIIKGIDKMTKYENGHSYSDMNDYGNNDKDDEYHNAYVGGDAYNYIINGNYATGFFVLGVGFTICGLICIGIATLISSMDRLLNEFHKNPLKK